MLIRYFNAYVLYPVLEKKSKRLIAPKLKELRRFEKLSKHDQDVIRKRELHRSLEHSRLYVPYYKDLFASVGFEPAKVLRDIKFIQDLPVLTKEIIRSETERIKLPSAHHVRKTGGSTGQSVYFYYDDVGLDWTSAINLLAYEFAGNHPYKLDAHISSEIGVEPTTKKGRFLDWLKLFSQNRSRVMVRSFSDEDLQRSFESLNSRRPFLLQGHPSSGYAIANYIERKGLRGPRYCSVFEPSGETLTPKMAISMENNLGCKVVNRYGNAEFGVMAHSRPIDSFEKLKVFDRAFYMEETQNSNLIVSNFTNLGFPLFRYETGDVGTVQVDADGTFISHLQGRIHDVVEIAGESYATHYVMDYLDHKIHGIREFQIVMLDDRHPILSIVAEQDSDAPRIQSEVSSRWPSGLEIRFVKFEELERVGWQNKFRHVIDKRTAHA